MENWFHIEDDVVDFKIYQWGSGNVSPSRFTWQKPRGCKNIFFMCFGAGGGGGGGCSGASGSTRGGGSGGASGTMVHALFPSWVFPNNMDVIVGMGGSGGAADANGVGGTQCMLIYPNGSTAVFTFLLMETINSSAGKKGTSAGGGTASGGDAAATSAQQPLISSAIWLGTASSLSGAGGAHTGAVGASLAWLVSNLLGGGCGGAGVGTNDTGYNGGGITAASIMPALAGGVAGGALDGQDGIRIGQTLYMTGGTGGASNGTGTGGKGGNGAIGCGGGGGGAGVTGGAGGRGGDGLVMIISY
jgi:hypothetical protein